MKEYDENEALSYIREAAQIGNKYSDDDLLLLIDGIFDFYDENDDFDANEEPSVDELISYVKKQLKKDKDNSIELDDVEKIVNAELDYEDSLDEE